MTQAVLQDLESALSPANVILRNGSQAWTADQSVGGHKLTDLADPTNPQDAATLASVVALIAGGLAGTGDVVGPDPGVDNALAIYDGTTGKLLKVGPVWRLASTGKMLCGPSYTPTVVVADAATITLNWNLSNRFQATLGGNRNIAFSNVTKDQPIKFRLYAEGFTPTWPAGIYWPGGVVPTPTATAGHWDNYVFECLGFDGYGNPLFEGYIAGQNFGA